MMDLPQPPQDTELRNIIDKLAQFVARNGPDFEQMTKNKQKGNPKFQFLYGGEYFNYYQYKVTTEQAVLKQQGIMENSPGQWSSPTTTAATTTTTISLPPTIINNTAEIEQITLQQENLKEQIKQSEQNLSAQHAVLLQQQQAQAEAVVAKCETGELQREADECDVDLQDIYGILQPIIDSCTKDSISNGKSWILQHASNKKKALCIVHSLLFKVVECTTFPQKLHVVYLVNDLLHHCTRKNANELKEALESVVVPMFCNAHMSATEEQQRLKLEKLLKLWESKTNYLMTSTVDKMRQPAQSYQQYQAQQMMKYSHEIGLLAQQTKATYDSYQAQHQAFVCHALQQIQDLEQQKQALEQQQQQAQAQQQAQQQLQLQQQQQQQQQQTHSINNVNHRISEPQPPPPTQAPNATNIIPLETIQASLQQTIQNLSQQNAAAQQQQQQQQSTQQQQSFPVNNLPTSAPPPPPAATTAAVTTSNDFMPQINPSIPPPSLPPLPPLPPPSSTHMSQQQQSVSPAPTASGVMNHLPPLPPSQMATPPPGMGQPPPTVPIAAAAATTNGLESIFTQPPPGFFAPPPPPGPGGLFPDFSKPPPGFLVNPDPPFLEEMLMPTAPYYDLPAGLIVPLIKLEDTSYKPLDPKDIRLPPPAPPSDRLLAAVEAFYALPSHERPRDSEGWEKLGLYEYYKAKNNAKREREEQVAAGFREKSRSPSPIQMPAEREPDSPPRRRYMSKTPSPTRSPPQSSQRVHRGGNSRNSKSRSRSRSRSRSPPHQQQHPRGSNTSRRKHSRNSGGRNRSRRSLSRSPSRSPTSRSPGGGRRSMSPPSLRFSPPFGKNDRQQELDSSNKGHQMLRKMGWGGSGLGANEQGIDSPISGGEVRDKQDQFRGVGCNMNDPYENFRKNKGAAFITRMKARAEERASEK